MLDYAITQPARVSAYDDSFVTPRETTFWSYLVSIHLQVYASYNYRRDLTTVVKVPGMLSRARSLSREEAETQEADVGKADVGVSVHPPTMRQAIAWELAMRNIRQSEVRAMHACATCSLWPSEGKC